MGLWGGPGWRDLGVPKFSVAVPSPPVLRRCSGGSSVPRPQAQEAAPHLPLMRTGDLCAHGPAAAPRAPPAHQAQQVPPPSPSPAGGKSGGAPPLASPSNTLSAQICLSSPREPSQGPVPPPDLGVTPGGCPQHRCPPPVPHARARAGVLCSLGPGLPWGSGLLPARCGGVIPIQTLGPGLGLLTERLAGGGRSRSRFSGVEAGSPSAGPPGFSGGFRPL